MFKIIKPKRRGALAPLLRLFCAGTPSPVLRRPEPPEPVRAPAPQRGMATLTPRRLPLRQPLHILRFFAHVRMRRRLVWVPPHAPHRRGGWHSQNHSWVCPSHHGRHPAFQCGAGGKADSPAPIAENRMMSGTAFPQPVQLISPLRRAGPDGGKGVCPHIKSKKDRPASTTGHRVLFKRSPLTLRRSPFSGPQGSRSGYSAGDLYSYAVTE